MGFRDLCHFSRHNSDYCRSRLRHSCPGSLPFPLASDCGPSYRFSAGGLKWREEWCKGYTEANGRRWSSGKKVLEKSLHLGSASCFFQYDSILVRNVCFGCSSRTEPVVDEDLGRRALLLSEDPLSSLPRSVCSGSGKNAKPSTHVSEMPHGVCYSPAICGSQSCQLVTTQGNPRRSLPHLPGGSSLFSD